MTAQDRLAALVGEFGEIAIKEAAEKLLSASYRSIPAEYVPVISPVKLAETMYQLDVALQEIDTAGKAREAAYANKRELLQQKTKLETAIKITEAQAFMNVKGEGKNAVGVIGDKEIPLTNDTNRDVYRRLYSQNERTHLAEVEAQLQALEVDIAQATDRWFTAKEAADKVQAKAHVQARLLEFLAHRG